MRTFFLLLLGGGWLTLAAQTIPPPPDGLKSQINYTVDDITYYRIPQGTDPKALSPMDLQKTKRHRTLKSVELRTGEDGEQSSTVLILNPEEAYAGWPEAMGRLEIDQTGIRTYRTNGTLFNTLPSNDEDIKMYEAIKEMASKSDLNIRKDFPMPDAPTLSAMGKDGWTIDMLSDGAVQMSNATSRVLLEPAYKRVTTATYEGSNLVEKRIDGFRINDQEILTPAYVRTETRKIMPSGACMERVHFQKYTDYHIAAIQPRQERYAVAGSNRTLLQPNPATDQVLLTTGDAAHQVTISDAYGKMLWEKTAVSEKETIEISVAAWPPGLYFVRLETAGGQQTHRFIKSGR